MEEGGTEALGNGQRERERERERANPVYATKATSGICDQ